LLQAALVLLDEGEDHGLGSDRDSVPKLSQQRRQRLHAAGLRSELEAVKSGS
jgi:hypothetical protein